MSDPFAGLPDEARERLEERPHPDWVEPMLATLTHDHFSDPGWIFERKLDGERCLAFCDGRLRHPVFLGLRRDKEPEDVHREAPGGS